MKKGRRLLTVHCDRFFFNTRYVFNTKNLSQLISCYYRQANQPGRLDTHHKGRFFFSTLVEILGYNEDPETGQDATELEQGYIHFPRNEKTTASVMSIARVQMKLDILIVQNISTTANFLNCRTILFFPMRFVSLLSARAPHHSTFYRT